MTACPPNVNSMLVAPVKYSTSFVGSERVTFSTCNINCKLAQKDGFSEKFCCRLLIYLAMNNSCYSQVPCRVSGHSKSKKWTDTVIVERGYEHSCSTASSKNIGPSPFVQLVIYVVDVTVGIKKNAKIVIIKLKPVSDYPKLHAKMKRWSCLAHAISCITAAKRSMVQLKPSPTAFQYGPSNPSSTSNHWNIRTCFNLVTVIDHRSYTRIYRWIWRSIAVQLLWKQIYAI